MDIYFFSAITNLIWYAFTILFLLYRFTTFFSWSWNFLIFLGRLLTCFQWIGGKISYMYNYYYNGYRPAFEKDIEDNPYEPLLDHNEKSTIMKIKENITNMLPSSWFKKEENNELYELYISELNTIPKFIKKSKTNTKISFEHAYFNSQQDLFNSPIDDTMTSDDNLLLESKFINENTGQKKLKDPDEIENISF